MKRSLIFLLLFMLVLGVACAEDNINTENDLAALAQTLAPIDVDLSLLTDEELEIFISLLQEQENADNFAYDTDGALSWQSKNTQNRLGGDWYSAWSNLPDPEGDVSYQALDDYSYIALVENYSLEQAQSYAESLAALGFHAGTTASENFYSWYGVNDAQSISLTWQDESLWLEYVFNAQ